jgi:Rrf2 family protein
MLSKKCQYALHALIYLSEHEDKEVIHISDIARSKKIPQKFLEIIMLDLKKFNILGSKRGKEGGYYLRKRSDEVSILEIVRMMDGAIAMLPCVSINFHESCGLCENEAECSIKRIFSRVRDETLNILSKSTIADLSKSPAVSNLVLRNTLP